MAVPNLSPSGQEPPFDKKDWWNQSGNNIAKSISSVVQTLKHQQRHRIRQLIDSARLYGNLPLFGPYGPNQVRYRQSYGQQMLDRVTFNLIQAVVDTLVSRMAAKNKPKPYFLTSGGTWKDIRKAKKLNKFIEGLFNAVKAYDLGICAMKNAAIHHDGLIHIFERDGKVCWELVPANEILIDEVQAVWGKPRQWHRVHLVDQGQAAALWPAHKQDIERADTVKFPDAATHGGVSPMVEVRESWHLRSGPKAKDGKHIITLEKLNLTKLEPYEHDFFPFAVLPWAKRQHGFWAQSAAERLENIQVNVNRMLMIVSRTLHLAGTFKIFVKAGSKVSKEHLTNELGLVVVYTGDKAPDYVAPPALQPEWWETIDKFIERAFDQEGVSMLSATSRMPAGLTSGTAIRSYDFIETDRFQERGRQYEEFFIDAGKISLSVARDILKETGHYKVKYGKKYLEEIDLKDIDLEEDDYSIQCFPVSALAQEPSARYQQIQEWVQAGWIDPRTGRELTNFPDLERIENLQDAQEEWLMMVLEKMTDDGEYTSPEPYMDLVLASTLPLQFYAYGKAQQLPEDRLDMLRQFMEEVDNLKPKPLPGSMPGAGITPQAQPMPPPTSPLIPNQPGAAA